jgi:hypothetical protein
VVDRCVADENTSGIDDAAEEDEAEETEEDAEEEQVEPGAPANPRACP